MENNKKNTKNISDCHKNEYDTQDCSRAENMQNTLENELSGGQNE